MLKLTDKGILIVMSGPSGAGKGTICAHLREKIPMALSISATTRKPRSGEEEGINYFFLTKEQFEEKIAADGFIEWARVYDNYYGTPRAFVEEQLAAGKNVMLEIDPQGAKNVKQAMPEAVLVFVMPPSFKELERRIRGRGTETEEQITKRLSCAVSEINTLDAYDYVIINSDLDLAVDQLTAIIDAEKCKVSRNTSLPNTFELEKDSE
ncbi:MAG: guanylate kinase [Peptococcaceae bacterium]|nr:guanylate kinase [Peptococcaceae bacterium]